MAELNPKQRIDRRNEEFTSDTRKQVFWYDDKADFAEGIDSVDKCCCLSSQPQIWGQ